MLLDHVCAAFLCLKPKLVFPMFGVSPSLLETSLPKNIPVTLFPLKISRKKANVCLCGSAQIVSGYNPCSKSPASQNYVCLSRLCPDRRKGCYVLLVPCSSQLKRLRVYKTFLSLFLLKLLHQRAMSVFLSRVETGVASRDVQK